MKNYDENSTKEKSISFKEYKFEATKHDVKSMKKIMRPKNWENIPIVGSISYLVRIQYAIQGIDRGPLRKEIWKWNLIFLLSLLIYIYGVICLLTPWITYAHTKISINKTEELIKKGDL